MAVRLSRTGPGTWIDFDDPRLTSAEAGRDEAARLLLGLKGGTADLFLRTDADSRPLFIATLPPGTALPPHLLGHDRLALRLRPGTNLVTDVEADGIRLWFMTLARAAGGAAEGSEAQLGTEALLARIVARAGRAPDELHDEAASTARRLDDTYGGFARLLRGTFRRDPGPAAATPLAAAAQRVAQFMQVKPAAVSEAAGETPLAFLERFAFAAGLRLRRLRLDMGERPSGEGPLIALTHDGHPLILLPRAGKGYRIEPPTAGPASRPLRPEDWETFRPEIFAFYLTLPDGKLSFRQILGFGLSTSKSDIGLIALCGVIGAVLAMFAPLASSKIAEIGVQSRDLEFLVQIMVVLLLVLMAETAFFAIRQLAELSLEGRSALALQAAMIDRLLRLRPAAIRGSGHLILATQMESVEKFRRPLIHFATSGTLALVYGITAGVLVAWTSPMAGLIAILLVLALAAITALIGWAQFKAIYEGERMDVIVLAFVYDLIRLIPVLRAMRVETHAFAQWAQNFLAFQSRIMRSARIASRLTVIEPCWAILGVAACFAALALSASGGHVGSQGLVAGEAIVFVLALMRLLQAGSELSHAMLGAAKLLPLAKLAKPMLDQEPEPRAGHHVVPHLSGRILVDNASFFHHGRAVLGAVTLSVPEGSFIGLAGPSGSGKTTLVRLLTGLEQPASGAVLIGGYDIRSLDRRQVARQIGVVTQSGELFPGSIYANIRGVTEIDLDEAWHYAGLAGIADELRALPMGLRTLVGEAGGLSRGQVLRILIARALAQQPKILILDETLGALDGRTQARVMDMLSTLDITRIVVAHRRSTLLGVDRLLMLDQGHLVDDGPPAAVMARHPAFSSLS